MVKQKRPTNSYKYKKDDLLQLLQLFQLEITITHLNHQLPNISLQLMAWPLRQSSDFRNQERRWTKKNCSNCSTVTKW